MPLMADTDCVDGIIVKDRRRNQRSEDIVNAAGKFVYPQLRQFIFHRLVEF